MITELTAFWLKKLSEDEVKFIYEVEVPMAEVLAQMEFNGVSVNVDYLKQLSKTMDNQLHRLERKIYDIADCGFNINSPKQVGEILFDQLGFDEDNLPVAVIVWLYVVCIRLSTGSIKAGSASV